MVKFIHTGDWQLGMSRRFLSPDAQARFTEARLEAVRAIARLAHEEGCSFVVVCGDVFESNQLERGIIARSLDALAGFDVPVYLLPGNHDPFDGGSVYKTPTFAASCPANVVVLDSALVVEVPGTGVELVPAPWPNKRPLEDLAASACAGLEEADGRLRVLVAHGAVDRLSPDPANPALIRLAPLEQALQAGLIHFAALGDCHSITEIGTTGRVWYSGSPLVTAFREPEPNHVLVVTLDAGTVSVERRQTGSWQFVEREFDVNGSADVDTVDRWLSTLPDKRCTAVRLSFVGTLSLAERAALDDLLDRHSDLLAALESDQAGLTVRPSQGDLDQLGLSGFAAAALEDLRGRAAAQGPEATLAQDALSLLYRLAGRPA